MKAWLMDDYGGIGGFRLADAPDPIAQPDEVVLQVHYAGLNPADRYLAENLYPAKPRLPHILGRDGMGTVVAVGAWSNAESRAAWQQVVELLARAGVRPQVDEVFPFDQLPQAFERLSQGPMGKVLLAVAGAGERGSALPLN